MIFLFQHNFPFRGVLIFYASVFLLVIAFRMDKYEFSSLLFSITLLVSSYTRYMLKAKKSAIFCSSYFVKLQRKRSLHYIRTEIIFFYLPEKNSLKNINIIIFIIIQMMSMLTFLPHPWHPFFFSYKKKNTHTICQNVYLMSSKNNISIF